jgi:predicted NACHT family NTPase
LKELRTADSLVIFDDLDEVPGTKRSLVRAALNQFAAVYPRCWVLVTCRTHSYQQDSGGQLPWQAEKLAFFSDAQMETFITR